MGWFAALGMALIGRELPDPRGAETPNERGSAAGPRPNGAEVAAALAAVGFDRERLADLVARRQADELPWPFPVSTEHRGDIGAAQFVSALRLITDELDVHAWRHAAPVPAGELTAADRRLLADKPPHWG